MPLGLDRIGTADRMHGPGDSLAISPKQERWISGEVSHSERFKLNNHSSFSEVTKKEAYQTLDHESKDEANLDEI